MKLKIPCVWPDPASAGQAVVKASSGHGTIAKKAVQSLESSTLSTVLPARLDSLQYKPSLSEDEHFLHRYFNETYTPLVFQRYAHPAFRTNSLDVVTGSKKVRCIMDLVSAISAMHLSSKMTRYNRISTEYYVSSISSLRTMVDSREIEGSEDWLMLVVILFCLYEVCSVPSHTLSSDGSKPQDNNSPLPIEI